MERAKPVEVDWVSFLDRAGRLGISVPVRAYPRGTQVFAQGDPSPHLYGVLEGALKLAHLLVDGRPLALRLVGPGDLFGKGALLGRPRQAYAEVLRPARLALWSPDALARVAAASPDLLLQILRAQAYEAYELQTYRLVAAYGTVEEELAVLLWFLQGRFGREASEGVILELKLTVRELASLLGRSRQRVQRAWLNLRSKGFVEGRYGRVVIKDPKALQSFIRPYLELVGGVRRKVSPKGQIL